MNVVEITILLLATVVLSSFADRLTGKRVPLPFVQIALGALLAEVGGIRIELEPELFLLLFIAPLLFLDGWHLPSEKLLRDRWNIAALALGLVLFTVVGAGYFIHWLVPAIPLAVAFALAAVLSPTDAVAVSAITARLPFPKRLMHILEGEALLNDATGLVCLRFAVAALLTGSFSPIEAAGSFVVLALGGLAVGAAVTVAANAAKDWVALRFGEETGTQILISILIPFVAYLLAARLGVSGILAAVAAGLAMNAEERSGRALAVTRIRRSAVWSAIQFSVNGVIFVLLGDQLPGIIGGAGEVARSIGHGSGWWLIADIAALYAFLLLLRLAWSWTTLGVHRFAAGRRGPARSGQGPRVAAVTAVAGVRGALTLSGVMSLPLVMPDGSPFPARDICILFAAGMIILSLLAAHLSLPPLIRGLALPHAPARAAEVEAARAAAALAAIETVEREAARGEAGDRDAALYGEAATRIVALYRQRLEVREQGGIDAERAVRVDTVEHGLRVAALHAERREIYRIARTGRLGEDAVRTLVREIDLVELRYSGHWT